MAAPSTVYSYRFKAHQDAYGSKTILGPAFCGI